MLLEDKFNRSCEIEMQINHAMRRAETHYELDFFTDSHGEFSIDDSGNVALLVPNIYYCIEQAGDWALYRGDFYNPRVREMDMEEGTVRHVDVFF